MLLELTGVLESGGVRAEGVPENPRKALAFPVGATVTIRVSVVTPDGNKVTAGEVKLTAKKRAALGEPAVLTKTGTLGASGQVDLAVTPAETRSLEPGRFAFDVWHTDGSSNRNPIVPLSPLWLEPAATLP